MGIFKKIYIWNLRRKLYKKEKKEQRNIWCGYCNLLGYCEMKKKVPEAIYCKEFERK